MFEQHSGGDSNGPVIDQQYNWLSLILRLADDDVTKVDIVCEREYLECLNILGYWHQRDKKQAYDNSHKN